MAGTRPGASATPNRIDTTPNHSSACLRRTISKRVTAAFCRTGDLPVAAIRTRSTLRLHTYVDDTLLTAACCPSHSRQRSAPRRTAVVVRDTRRPHMPPPRFPRKKFARTTPGGRPDPRRIRGMGMMQDHRRPELPRQFLHLLAAPVPLAPGLHVGLGPRTEHVQVVAPQNEHAFRSALEQVRLQIGFLHKRPFLPRHRVGLSGPPHRLAPFRNLSTTLRHRRFLFTDSFLLLWKWRVG